MTKKKEGMLKTKAKEVIKEAVAEIEKEVAEEETPMVVKDPVAVGKAQEGVVAGTTSGFYVYTDRGALHTFTTKEKEAEEVALELGGTYREVA